MQDQNIDFLHDIGRQFAAEAPLHTVLDRIVQFVASVIPCDSCFMYVLEGNTQDPTGGYTFKGKIAATTDRWAIDGTVLEHAGSRYMVWSGWPGTTRTILPPLTVTSILPPGVRS